MEGIPVYVDNNLGERTTIQNRHHKRKRINKKWRKRYGFWTKIKPYCVLINNRILCNDIGLHMLKAEMEKRNRLRDQIYTIPDQAASMNLYGDRSIG